MLSYMSPSETTGMLHVQQLYPENHCMYNHLYQGTLKGGQFCLFNMQQSFICVVVGCCHSELNSLEESLKHNVMTFS